MRALPILAGLLLLAAAAAARADLVVIVNPASGVERLTREEAIDLFMGRSRRLPSGVSAIPVDEAAAKAPFYRSLVDKDLPEIQSYWARLVFSGRASPPQQAANAAEAVEMVAQNRGAIGYVDRARVDRRVRIVLELGPR